MNEGLFRLRVHYVKHDRLRYLGHLEVLGTIDRCVRRSGLPFDVTNGFSPRMRMQFSSALPVAAASDCEWYDLFLREKVDEAAAFSALLGSTPADLAPVRAGYVSTKLPAIESWLTRMRWTVDVSGIEPGALDAAIGTVRDEGSITYLRGTKEKTVDLGPTLVGWACERREGGTLVTLDTRTTPTGSLRPSLLVTTALDRMGASPDTMLSVCRRGQWGEEDGRLVEPLG